MTSKFKVGDKVTWDGRVPYYEGGYSDMQFEVEIVTITKIDSDERMNHKIISICESRREVTFWVNAENLTKLKGDSNENVKTKS